MYHLGIQNEPLSAVKPAFNKSEKLMLLRMVRDAGLA